MKRTINQGTRDYIAPDLDPQAAPILYHYCSPISFHSIIRTKCIRFSDINLMNDSSEMKWGYQQFSEMIKERVDFFVSDFSDLLDNVIRTHQYRTAPLVSSSSRNGDLLSQWRAYASDGQGFSIGFNAEIIHDLPIRGLEVVYDPAEQKELMFRYLKEAYDRFKSATNDDVRSAILEPTAAFLAIEFSCFKSPSYSEEKEIRLIRVVNMTNKRGSLSFVDPGGKDGSGAKTAALPVEFWLRDGQFVPYIDLPVPKKKQANLIRQVILGPRNPNGAVLVGAVLRRYGFEDVEVRRSEISYKAR